MEQQQDIRELRRLLNESLQDMREATQRTARAYEALALAELEAGNASEAYRLAGVGRDTLGVNFSLAIFQRCSDRYTAKLMDAAKNMGLLA